VSVSSPAETGLGDRSPMLAVAGQPPSSGAWLEWKFDGHRCRIEHRGDDGPRLVSRGGRLVTDRFPEVSAAISAALGPRDAVLDGELVAPGPGGLPDFERLQARARSMATPARVAASPVSFVAFDLLALDGQDLTGRPLRERRALLDGLGLAAHPRLQLSPVFIDVDPAVLLATAREHGVEGIVSKRPGSRYAAGRRSKAWIKTVITQRSIFVVGAVAQGRSRRPGAVGSLLLGAPTSDGGLEFVGEVGTGWSRAEHAHLTTQLEALASDVCPFSCGADRLPRDAQFVRPVLQGLVAYREHRPGRLLRHPSWKGLTTEDRHPEP
jgi:bifunctional non-homologous end joining protein LigD